MGMRILATFNIKIITPIFKIKPHVEEEKLRQQFDRLIQDAGWVQQWLPMTYMIEIPNYQEGDENGPTLSIEDAESKARIKVDLAVKKFKDVPAGCTVACEAMFSHYTDSEVIRIYRYPVPVQP